MKVFKLFSVMAYCYSSQLRGAKEVWTSLTPETEGKNNEPLATNRLKVKNVINEPAISTSVVQPESHPNVFSGINDNSPYIIGQNTTNEDRVN